MRRLLLIAGLSAIVLARPETYKETEDFQYSRSSSDDGTKSGFYGAQRGNMGGNYERAHNMDTLAQHQMSGLVRQVDGELGDGAKTRTGSVYTAANSRGIYGSGNYDLTNLQGRNFAEGESIGNSQSHSSLSHNSRYGAQAYSGMESSAGISSSSHAQDARYSGYQTSRNADQRLIDNLQAVDTSQGLGRYESNNQAGYDMKYHTQYGSHGHSEFDQSTNHHNGYDANSQARFITTPVRVVVRPGGRVAIPIAAPTYSVSQNVLPDENAVNSDAEILNSQGGSMPTNKVKQYEASYSYRKQWEKHHSIPGDVSIVVPTENPFPKNSELYEDVQQSGNHLQNANSQRVHSGTINTDHRAYTKSAASGSRFQTGYNSQSAYDSQQSHSGLSSQQVHSGLSPHQAQSGVSSNLNSQQSHSGLSSHHGQSGVSSNMNSEQTQSRLSSQHSQLGFNAQQSQLGYNLQHSSASSDTHANAYGHNAQLSGRAAELTNAAGDINTKPKSYQSSYSYHKSWERQGDPYVIKPVGGVYDGQVSERLTAATSNSAAYTSRQYGSHSRQAHQSYSADCDDQGHLRVARSYNTDQEIEQGQNQWEDLGQQTQTQYENLEDLGQQQEIKWDNMQDLGQQTQDLHHLGQETQNQWDNFQQTGQQTQRDLEQHQNANLEDFSPQSQKEVILTNFEQQVNNQNENLEDLKEHTQKEDSLTNFEQQFSNQNENLDIFSQHSQSDSLTNFEQQSSNYNENSDIFNQHSQSDYSLNNFEQQFSNQNENLDIFSQHSQSDSLTNFEQQSSNYNENSDIFNQHSQSDYSLNNFEQQVSQNEQLPNNYNWGDTAGFQQSNIPQNTDFFNHQFQLINNQHSHNQDLFEQHQHNQWHDFRPIVDISTDSNEFMKPISQGTDNTEKNTQQHELEHKLNTFSDTQNLYSSSNTGWSENKEQGVSWNTHFHQNTNNNDKYDHIFHNNQFENNFPPKPPSTSDAGNPLQSFWDKIDNIAGEITPTGVNTAEQESQNFNQVQNGIGWNFPPMNTNVDLVNTNFNKENKEGKSGHNLFDEQTQQATSTTILPILVSSTLRPAQNNSISTTTNDEHPSDTNKNIPSPDVGRGDIEPEETPIDITTNVKPSITPEEIETLSLTKDAKIPKEFDVTNQPSSIMHENKNTGNVLLTTDLSQNENTNDNGQYKVHNTRQAKITTTKPIEVVSTTEKKIISHTIPTSHGPSVNEIDLKNNLFPDIQTQLPHKQPVENVELPENIQQQNLDQQYEDFSQLQGSWLQSDNLQQGIDQQNMEQQFEVFQQHENVQDQNPLHTFGQHSTQDLDQQSLQNFEQQSLQNFEQQSTQDLDQQSLQNFEQQSTQDLDQQSLQNFEQQLTQDLDQQSFQNFGQDIQSFPLPPRNEQHKEVKPEKPSEYQYLDQIQSSTQSNQQISPNTYPDTPQIIQPKYVSQNMGASSSDQNLPDTLQVESSKNEDLTSPEETTSKKPGFWKSIGNKFTSAKDKVYSWFSGS